MWEQIKADFKWYRERKGGHWTQFQGGIGSYWLNRRPDKWNEPVINTELYEKVKG